MKAKRPWFSGIDAPRSYINFITRLRSGHICTKDHYARMGWTLSLGCSCREDFSYLFSRFSECNPEEFGLEASIYSPSLSVVIEVGKFFAKGNIIL